jgi:hypothetical protein
MADPELLALWAKKKALLQVDRNLVKKRLEDFDLYIQNNELELAEDIMASLLNPSDRHTDQPKEHILYGDQRALFPYCLARDKWPQLERCRRLKDHDGDCRFHGKEEEIE